MKALVLTLLISFAITATANEEYDAVFVDGPGVFTGDKGHWNLEDLKKSQNNAENDNKSAPTQSIKPIALDTNKDEFELFKIWRQAKQDNNNEYQEFLDWRAYQQYKRSRR